MFHVVLRKPYLRAISSKPYALFAFFKLIKCEGIQRLREIAGKLYFMLKISRGLLEGSNFSLSVRKSNYCIQLQAVLIELKD